MYHTQSPTLPKGRKTRATGLSSSPIAEKPVCEISPECR